MLPLDLEGFRAEVESRGAIRPFISTSAKAYQKYGYRLNVNEPFVSIFFKRWKKKKGINEHCPLSDEERLTFECDALPYIERHFNEPAPPPNIPVGPYRDKIGKDIHLFCRIYKTNDVEAVKAILKKE